MSRFVTNTQRLRQLRAERFMPWPLPPGAWPYNQTERVHRDPYDLSTWGSACGRGFVRDERFSGGSDLVIKGTNRASSRKWRALDRRKA